MQHVGARLPGDELERGRWQGRIEATQDAHGKRITRIEVALIALVVYLATRSAEQLMKVAGL